MARRGDDDPFAGQPPGFPIKSQEAKQPLPLRRKDEGS